MKKIKSAIVISDIRNFTGVFEKFQRAGDDSFVRFISKFYKLQMVIAESLDCDYWYNPLGDSMLFLFKGKNHSKNAYAFSMILHRNLKKLINQFNDEHDEDVSFGIGIDCGEVFEVVKNGEVFTYLGNVINVVSRIEKLTKKFGETELLVGNNIYNYIMQSLYPVVYSENIFHSNYNKILKDNPGLVLMSKNIFLYYIFKLNLDGIRGTLALFRYDNELSSEYSEYRSLLNVLVGSDVIDRVERGLKKSFKNVT